MLKKVSKGKSIAYKILAVALIGSLAGGYFYYNNPVAQEVMAQSTIETYTLAKQDISNFLSVSGTLYSNKTVDITSLLSSTITEIFVNVGDKVEAGELLLALDKTDLNNKIVELENSIFTTQTSIDNNISTNILSLESSNIQFVQQQIKHDAIIEEIEELENGSDDEVDNDQTVKTAKDSIANLEKSLINFQENVDDAQRNYDTTLTNYDKQKLLYENAAISKTEFESSETSLLNAEITLSTAKRNYNDCIDDILEAEDTYEEAIEDYFTNKEDTLKTLYSSLEDSQLQLDSAGINVQKAQDTLNQYTTGTSSSDLSIQNTQLDLDAQYESLKNSDIIATTSGTITASNAQVGSTASGVLFTLEDTEDLYVAVTVTESDLEKVVVGQPATVSTEATGVQSFTGEVTYISPKAVSGGDGTMAEFEVHITIDEPNTDLIKLGMNGFANIIIEASTDTFVIPYEILTQVNRTPVVYTLVNDEVVAIPVELGVQSSNMVEIISAELSAGMEIIIDPTTVAVGETVDTSLVNSQQDAQEQGMGTGMMKEGMEEGMMNERMQEGMQEGMTQENIQERMQQKMESGTNQVGTSVGRQK